MTQWLLEEAGFLLLEWVEADVAQTVSEEDEQLARLQELARNATRPH